MIKPLLITGSLCLALGSLGGYFLQKMEVTSSTPSSAPIAEKPKITDDVIAANIPKKVNRDDLLLKLSLCLNRPISKQLSDKWTDKQLNDLTFDACQSPK